jgi:hypothetical protein
MTNGLLTGTKVGGTGEDGAAEQHALGPVGQGRRDLADKGNTLRSGTLVDATIIDAPSSTKNKAGVRDRL